MGFGAMKRRVYISLLCEGDICKLRVGKGISPWSILPESFREEKGGCVQEKASGTGMGLNV